MLNTLSFKVPYTVIGPGTVSNIGEIVRGLRGTKVMVTTDPGVLRAGLLDKIESSLEKMDCEFEGFDACEANAPESVIEGGKKIVK